MDSRWSVSKIKALAIAALVSVCSSSYAANEPFELLDSVQPGALVRGKTSQGVKVWFDETPLKVSTNGHFVFGIGRDDTGEVTLRWQNTETAGSVNYTLPARQYDIQAIDGLPSKMVSPPAEALKRIREDNKNVAVARQSDTDFNHFMQSFIWPAEGRISGVYGSQRILNGEPKRPHFGVDVAGPVGTPVVAPADGIITLWVPDMYYSGGTLVIDHGHKVSTTFIHLNASYVKQGDRVTQGQVIAEIGDTGRVTGAHLDWRINWGRVRVDPALLVPPRN